MPGFQKSPEHQIWKNGYEILLPALPVNRNFRNNFESIEIGLRHEVVVMVSMLGDSKCGFLLLANTYRHGEDFTVFGFIFITTWFLKL